VASATVQVGRRRKSRSREQALSYSMGHRIRVEIVAALNEGPRTADQLARIVRQPVNKITHHIEELVRDKSIEVAWTERVRNFERSYYRAIKQIYYTDEEFAAMTPEEKKVVVGLPLQSIMAESLSAYWSGSMLNDSSLWLAWRWFNVDREGRQEIAEEQAAFWDRMKEIETRSTARRTKSNEEAVSVIVTELGFERSRPSEAPPDVFDDGENLTAEE
jgi:DNA-binding transcriptional ArsR family regulator